jgi:hypothetical protein
MPSTPIQRTGRQRRSVNPALRSLGMRKYAFALRTGTRPGVQPLVNPVPDMPPNWLGTLPEWAIFWAHGEMELVEGRDFIYLYQTHSINDPLSIQVDFLEITHGMIAIQVQGTFFHMMFGGAKIESDLEQRVRIQSQGFTPVYIDEWDANTDPIFYLSEALQYRDYSLLARGLA